MIGSSRSPGKAGRLRALGAEPIVLDALDAPAVRAAVAAARPDAIIYQATVLALEHDGPAVYNVVDDEPAPASEWLPVLADALGAKPPRHVPLWLARLVAGEAGVVMMTEARGASNARAKEELGWTLRYPSWCQGFTAAYSQPKSAKAAA